MPLVSESYQENKLKKNGINIKTKYIVGNQILERNTDNSKNDNINKGIRCGKEYYYLNKLTHKEKIFDSRIEYTFISNNEEDDYKCGNCGFSGKVKDFVDGCPYCDTNYNIDYSIKDLGSKYHYDLVLKSTKYRVVTGIIDLIVSLIISFIFIKITGRTFNIYDISKVFLYGLILSLILYYFFYMMDAYFILGPIKEYKKKINNKQRDFWNRTKIDKKSFYNNLNFEIRDKYYNNSEIIDYDILDFNEFNDYEKNGKYYVEVSADVRIVTFNNGKISSKYITDTYVMYKNNEELLELKDGINYIKCHNCGASINVLNSKCDYCDTVINNIQEWIMEK